MDLSNKIFFLISLFILGAGVGSFIGVLFYRIRHKQSVFGRSICEKCKVKLSSIELIPIVSWFLQKGQCRKCQKKINKIIPLTEIFTAVLFFVSFLLWRWSGDSWLEIIQFGIWLIILTGLIALLIFDQKYKILPNKIIFPLMSFSAIFCIISHGVIEQITYSNLLIEVFLSMLPVAGVYLLIYTLSKGKLIGYGDVKLGIIIGFLLPWQGSLAVLFLANILAFIVLLPLLLIKKTDIDRRISFGPYLISATILIFLLMQTGLITF